MNIGLHRMNRSSLKLIAEKCKITSYSTLLKVQNVVETECGHTMPEWAMGMLLAFSNEE